MTTTSAGLYGQPQRATAARLADGAAFPPIPSGRRIRSITIIFDEGQDNPTPSELGSGLAETGAESTAVSRDQTVSLRRQAPADH